MSEHLAWVQWWACPWQSAHADWGAFDENPALKALYRSEHMQASARLGIAPLLAPMPNTTVLRLTLLSGEQLQRMLLLIDQVSCPVAGGPLNEEELLWCQRFSKALPPSNLLFDYEDPLQLLHHWVDPATWQRLRLRFARQRVLALEQQAHLRHDSSSRLDTLWQAVVWRITTLTNDDVRSQSNSLDTRDVLPAEN